MPGASSREVLRHLNTLFHCGAARPLTDQELLERFVAGDNEAAEAAFAALVDRHGAMVLGVCRRLLGNRHAAEDAFQSVFLVLARKAQAIARREQLASWLYGVARHDALDARARAARQKAREKRLGAMVPVEPRDETLTRELRTILDEELGRLPEKHRVAIVLCELEGLSRREAAIRLGVTEGTLSSRLARAKARLRDRLTRRGLAFSTAILASVLTQDAHALTVPPALFDSTIRLATLVAAGTSLAGVVSTSVVTLTDGVLKAMLLAKLKVVVLSLAAAALFTTGVGVLAQERGSDEDRLKNVERKLDKLLEVLGGSNRKAAAGAPETTTAAGGLVPIGQAPGSTPPTADGAVPASGMPSRLPPQIQQGQPARYPHELPAWEAAPGMFHGPTTGTGPTLAQRPQDTPQPKSLAARVGAVEQRLGDLERQIGDLNRRLQQIDGLAGLHANPPSARPRAGQKTPTDTRLPEFSPFPSGAPAPAGSGMMGGAASPIVGRPGLGGFGGGPGGAVPPTITEPVPDKESSPTPRGNKVR